MSNKIWEDGEPDPISDILESDPELVRLRRLLMDQQGRLKSAVSLKVFRLYLAIEATEGKITDVLAERCWQTAQRAGRRKKRPRRG